jgi:hypothetical protein
MGVRQVVRKAGRKKKPKKVLDIPLPTEMTEPETDIRKYIFLVYAPPGWGKTTLCSTFPGAMFMCTEAGTKGVRRYEYNEKGGGCYTWEIIEAGVRELEKDKSPRFKNVCIDTVRRAYEMCSDAYCEEHGIERPGETPDGQKDWGVSWRGIATKFMELLERIQRTGRGVCLSSHAKAVELEDADEKKHNYVQPNLSGSCLSMLTAFVDFGFAGETILTPDGDNARVLITEGNEGMWGKHRELDEIEFPRVLPIPDKKSGYKVIRSAFLGKEEHVKINLDDLRTGVLTSKAMASLLSTRRMAEGRRRAGKGGRKKKRVVKRG